MHIMLYVFTDMASIKPIKPIVNHFEHFANWIKPFANQFKLLTTYLNPLKVFKLSTKNQSFYKLFYAVILCVELYVL